MTFEEARAQFPVLERLAYLNAGSFGPLARATHEAVVAEERRELEHGRSGKEWFADVMAARERVRAALAGLIGVPPELLALTSSTTEGVHTVLAGLELRPEDEVVTTDSEHFGLIGPLHASRARVVVSEPDAEALVAAVTPRTRLLALSHVLWTTGAVLPVHELRERTGVPILVDGAQAAGAIPVSAAGLDFYTVSCQKWLCGPASTGALYVADPERLRVGRPGYLSQASYEPDGAFVPKEGAVRFEGLWVAPAATAGLEAALAGRPAWAFDRAAEAAGRCRELLAPLADVVPGGATLVSFRDDDPPATVARLAEAGIVVRDIPGRGLVRASCGYWTSDGDLERLAAAL